MSEFFENFENPTFQLRSSSTKHQCRIDIWQGNPSINIWGDQDAGQKGPIFRRPLNSTMLSLIKRIVKQVVEGPPDTRRPLVISKYNPDEKKYHPDYTLTFLKNGERIYQVQISYKDGSAGEKSYTFDFMAPSNIAVSSEAMNPADRSQLMIEIFSDWLKTILPFAMVLTKRKYQRSGGDQRRSSNNSSENHSGGGGGYFS